MSFSAAKKIFLLLGANRAPAQEQGERTEVGVRSQGKRCHAVKVIAAATAFLTNNLRKVLLFLVIAFFVIRIISGAFTAFHQKRQPPDRRNSSAVGHASKTVIPENFLPQLVECPLAAARFSVNAASKNRGNSEFIFFYAIG